MSSDKENRLLEFRAGGVVQRGSGQVGQEFGVRSAFLWLKADLLPAHLRRVGRNRCRSTDQFDRVTADPVSIPLEEHNSGWQKIDLTHLVRQWLNESKRDKLRLFVDCSCCSDWRVHLLNDRKEAAAGERDVFEDEREKDGLKRRANPDRPFLVVHVDPKVR
ncbi:unnamed protein product [Phaedon cochleariae]|uniref:Uncharacterized protein n=1 Tax=Phaedon cochleariae TaxID=80249 RepID=A0A9N9X0R6_PHACE|nr:unnamed protein product [Phaedon cochleariae]